MTPIPLEQLYGLPHLAVIVATGQDAKTFLQGQLSADLGRLTSERIELASCNSAQGRVQAVIWLIERSGEILLLVPASMTDSLLARLRKYVLRAKVKLESGANRYQIAGAIGVSLAAAPKAHQEIDGRSWIQWPGDTPRVLCVTETSHPLATSAEFSADWRRVDIAAGLPQVYPQTHEAFVAQMLNLDVLGGISFEKGCYTGQEIIARTHYRGTIKRRMFRFRASAEPPEPGTRVLVQDQHAGEVVDAVSTAGGCELLAVVTLAHIGDALTLDVAEHPSLVPQPLPYQV
jgi:folate-binding protein YgfZ